MKVEKTGADRILQIVAIVGDTIGNGSQNGFHARTGGGEGRGVCRNVGPARLVVPGFVVTQARPRAIGEIESAKLRERVFKVFDDTNRVCVMVEPAVILHQGSKRLFAGVTERRMSEVMRERNGFRQRGVHTQTVRKAPGNVGHLKRMRHPRTKVVTDSRREDLRLAFEAPEPHAFDDSVTVEIKRRT